jgi:hypothetical protein
MSLPVLDAPSGWRLAPETPPPAAWWPQALMSVAVLDEITEEPAATSAASTTTSGLEARASGGLAGLVGQPLRRLRPGFITGAPLSLTLSGPGFLPLTLNSSLGAEPGYPAVFTPVDLGSVALHRAPVTITGRITSHTGVVRAGASVTLAGVWLTIPDLVNPPTAPNLLSLASPAYADRGVTGTVASKAMTAAPPAQTKTLLRPGNIGDTSVLLSDQTGLSIGAVVALDPQDPARAEYLTVTALVNLGAGPGFPTVVELAFPLSREHAQGAAAIPMVLGATGAANALSSPARTGDATLLTAAMTGLSLVNTPIVVAGGGAVAEYHFASPIAGVSDAQGFVTLPAVHRAAQLHLRVHHPAEPVDLLRDVMLPLGVTSITSDFVFP